MISEQQAEATGMNGHAHTATGGHRDGGAGAAEKARPLHVGFFSNFWHIPRTVGYNRYALNLVPAIQKQRPGRWTLFGYSENPVHPLYRPQLDGEMRSVGDGGRIGVQARFRRVERNDSVDLWHVLTDEPVPLLANAPVVMTCHGLPRWLRHRHMLRDGQLPGKFADYQDHRLGWTTGWFYLRHWLWWKAAVLRADAIFADSEYVRWELTEKFGVPARKIHVVYLAADPLFERPRSADEVRQTREHFGLPEVYVLAVASFSRTKNTDGLLRLAKQLGQLRPPVPMVLVGPAGIRNHYEEVARRQGLSAGRDIWLIEDVFDDELCCLYRGARLFVNLAWEESFCLPAVEAMAAGIPVVGSSLTAVPEIVGDGGLLADPRDPEGVFATVRSVLTSPSHANELRERAARRNRFFSWEKSARQTLSVYDQVLAARQRKRRPSR
jgi:glycosyltransferase involved in cell wall biosynthesis